MIQKIRLFMAFLLGALFVYAGISKVLDPVRFYADVKNYDLIPWRVLAVAFAFYLPWLEIVCGISVFVRSLRASALMMLMLMLCAFTAALAVSWARGLNISCGCFGGGSEQPHYLLWTGRDVGLLAVCVVLTVAEWGALKPRP